MGNFFNETKLQGIDVEESSIIFDFGVSENSILAGGQFCPNLSILSNSENSIVIDIKNLVFEEEIVELMKSNLVNEFKSKKYDNANGKNHSVFNIKLSDVNEYTCELVSGEDGVEDLVIKFK